MSLSTATATLSVTVATATVSVYRAMFTLSGDNVQPLLSTFNEKKTKIKKYDHNTFSDMTKQTMGHSVHPPSLVSVLGGRIKKAG